MGSKQSAEQCKDAASPNDRPCPIDVVNYLTVIIFLRNSFITVWFISLEMYFDTVSLYIYFYAATILLVN